MPFIHSQQPQKGCKGNNNQQKLNLQHGFCSLRKTKTFKKQQLLNIYIYTTCSFQSTSLAKKYTYQWSFRMKRFFETDYFHGWKATSVASLALIRDDAAAYRTKEAKDVCHIIIVVNGLYFLVGGFNPFKICSSKLDHFPR